MRAVCLGGCTRVSIGITTFLYSAFMGKHLLCASVCVCVYGCVCVFVRACMCVSAFRGQQLFAPCLGSTYYRLGSFFTLYFGICHTCNASTILNFALKRSATKTKQTNEQKRRRRMPSIPPPTTYLAWNS